MRKLLSIITFFTVTVAALAQSSISVKAPNLVASDEQFNVVFIINGSNKPSDFNWDPGADFQLVWGPQKGYSSNVQIINGKRSGSSQTTYTYVLIPQKTGTFYLPQATATVKGKTITSARYEIKVAAGQTSSAAASSASSSNSAVTGDISGKDLFLKLTLDKTKVVMGEPIKAVLKLYQRVDIAGVEAAKFPTFNGFWSQTVQSPANIEFQREELDGKIYNAALIRSYVLIPQQSGTITVDPAEMVCLVNVRSGSSSGNSIFDSFFQDDMTRIRKRVVSSSYKVHVSPLPSGAPASFGGGVGSFTVTARLSKNSIKAHDAASLFVTVSGKGNVSLLEAPKVTFPPDFDAYDTKSTQNTDKSGTSGSKTFEYPFIPRSHGKFAIGPVEYSYYDINARKYVTIKTQPIGLDVSKGNVEDNVKGGNIVPSVDRNDVKNLGNDIRFIVSKEPSFAREGVFFLGSLLFWILLLILTAATVLTLFLFRKMAVRRADVAGTKNRKATKMALKRLRHAGEYLKQNLYSAFYEELHRALLGFISDKLTMSVEDLNKDNISAALKECGIDDGLNKSFTDLVDACEYARYSPDAGHSAMSAHFDSAVKVISSIDSKMKGKKNNIAGAAVILMLLFVLPGIRLAAGNNHSDSLWTKGVSAYTNGNWSEAVARWGAIEKTGAGSPELYYNIGNAYYKSGDYPHSILYYERALKSDPSYSDARYNLELVNGLIKDKIDPVPEFILKSWARDISYILSSNVWAVLFLVFAACLFVAVILFWTSPKSSGRKLGFYSALTFLILSLCSLGFSAWQKNEYTKVDSAIVMSPVSSVKSSPSSESSKDLFVLHEGTKLKIIDELGEWNNIELADGRQGWIKKDNIEII
ncbi:MAG: BatD family protein [Bacteroidales bacterium]|nr:BatD family protein [Bacteroidales bacterium]MCI1785553.1 BatD family protein [Bacteroidales bacterium]